MRAAVTGGAGFIGSNLVDALSRAATRSSVVDNFATGKREHLNPAATLLEHDIREPFEVEADVVFHLAAQADVQTSMKRPEYDAAVNVVGTVNVLQALARRPGDLRLDGRRGLRRVPGAGRPRTRRSCRSRRTGSRSTAARSTSLGWNRIHGTTHVSLRFANVYGPRQDAGLEGGVVAIFLERLARGEETTIFGDGSQSRDFVYVGDVVAALLAAVGRGGGPFNVGTGDGDDGARAASRVRRACAGVDAEPKHEAARLGDVQRSVLDVVADRARARLAPAGLARRRPRPNLGVDAGSAPRRSESSAAVDAPLTHPTHSSAPGGPRRSSRASSPRSSSSCCSAPASSCSRSRCRTRSSSTPTRRRSHPRRSTRPRPSHRAGGRSALPKLTRAETGVFVLNGNGRSGAAASEAAKLSNLGYHVPGTGNAKRQDYATTVVMYRPGFQAEALRLARDLHVKVVGPLDGLKPVGAARRPARDRPRRAASG